MCKINLNERLIFLFFALIRNAASFAVERAYDLDETEQSDVSCQLF